MESRHDRDALVRLPGAAQLRDALFRDEQVLRRHVAEGHDDLRVDGTDLFLHEADAGFDLVWFGIAVPRRAAFDDVADVDVLALQLHALDNDVRQELAGLSDKGSGLLVFFKARPFTDEYDRGLRVPFAEDYIRSARMQFAPCAVAQLFTDGLQGTWLFRDAFPSPLVLPLEGGGRQGGGDPGFTR